MLENTTVSKFPNDRGTYTSTEIALFAGANGKELREAIDTLYDAFADACLSNPLEGCLHCFTAADLDYLRVTPLRALTHGDLSLIDSKAISTSMTWQSTNDSAN